MIKQIKETYKVREEYQTSKQKTWKNDLKNANFGCINEDWSLRNNTWVVGAAETHQNKNCKRYLKNTWGEKTLL